MFRGQNGVITSFPNVAEKICVSFEHLTGGRDITQKGKAIL